MPTVEEYALGLLTEESGEISQLVGKSFRFGVDTPRAIDAPDETARHLLNGEVGDMLAAIEYAIRNDVLDREKVRVAYEKKLARLFDPNATDNLGRPLTPRP